MDGYQAQAKIFKALAHKLRLRILDLLASHSAYVCDLVMATDRRQAYISQHLAMLREVRLVQADREGLNVRYHLAQPEALEIINAATQFAVAHLKTTWLPGDSMNDPDHQWHAIPRPEIEWYPTLVADRCDGCGLCATSCEHGVFAFEYEANLPVVIAPMMCMVGCTTCATLCPQDALEFPSQAFIHQVIHDKKVVLHAKDMLRDNREKYDVKQHQSVSN